LSRRNEIIERIRSLQGLPASAVQILNMIQDPDIDIGELTKIIEFDPGLTANLLKLANSAYFGMPRKVNSVREAAIRLGTNRISQLVIASAIAPIASKAVKGYDLPAGDLWTHAVAVAIGTEKMGLALNLKLPDHAFTAGLLHDIGKIIMGTFIEVDASPIMQLAFNEGVSFDAAEREILGIDHAEVGSLLLAAWKLPTDITEIVRYHHIPDEAEHGSQVLEMVHLANNLCLLGGIGSGMDGLNYRPSRIIVEKYNLKPKITEPVVMQIVTGLEGFHSWFNQ